MIEKATMNVKAARVLCKRQAEACGIDPRDDWNNYSEVYTGDAHAMLEACGAYKLLEACQTFAEWLRREDAGFDHKTHDRETPEGEAAWRVWFYENLRICDLAQEQARAAITKATEAA